RRRRGDAGLWLGGRALRTERGADDRREEVLHQGVDDRAEGRADDDTGRQVDDVAAQDELAETADPQRLAAAPEELLHPLDGCVVTHQPLRCIPAARPFAATTSAIFRDASSIISLPSMTAPR